MRLALIEQQHFKACATLAELLNAGGEKKERNSLPQPERAGSLSHGFRIRLERRPRPVLSVLDGLFRLLRQGR